MSDFIAATRKKVPVATNYQWPDDLLVFTVLYILVSVLSKILKQKVMVSEL